MMDLLILQIIVCYLVDLSGFITSLEWWLGKMFKVKITIPKPFSCSLCLGWWLGLIYLIIVHRFTLPYIVVVAGLSFFSQNITGFLRWIQQALIKIEELLYKLIR